MLFPGTEAPPIDAVDQHGRPVTLADFREKWVVLWWYAKASTAG